MEKTEREALEKEFLEIQERLTGEFIDPKDMRRKDQITSLLMTDGQSDNIKFKLLKSGSRSGHKGLYTKKGYNKRGPVGG